MEPKTSQPVRKPPVTRAVATVQKQKQVITRQVDLDLSKFPNLMNLEQNLMLLEYAFSKMEPGIDYGTETGITKPFLHISGTERLQQVFGLRIELEDIDDSRPAEDYFRHKVVAKAYGTDKETGEMVYIGMGVGSCSTRESKYRYRWLSAKEIPTQFKMDMMVTRQDRDGKAYDAIDMQKWIDVNGLGTVKMTKFGVRCRFDNADTADLDNTVLKQAAKRARADVVQNVTGAHRMFARTEDLEAVGLDSVKAEEIIDESLENEPPMEAFGDLPFEQGALTAKQVEPASATTIDKKQTTTSKKQTPATQPVSADPSKRPCPIHPGAFHTQWPMADSSIVWAHKLEGQFSPSKKQLWCTEKTAIERARLVAERAQSPAPDDMDAVNVKDNFEFLATLTSIGKLISYGEPELIEFLKLNYPTSGIVLKELPMAVRLPILKDLRAIYNLKQEQSKSP